MSKRIAIVGNGTMGNVLAKALANEQITLVDRTGFSATDWTQFDTICFAIKPQDFKTLSPLPLSDKLIISIMAGITTSALTAKTGSSQIIRCMPNTPLRVSMGMTVWCRTAAVSQSDADWLSSSLQPVTALLEVANDDWVDKATAVSASGPGFVFAAMNQYLEATKQLGFSESEAQQLVQQTFIGAIKLLQQSNSSAQELQQQVTSKGGTTAAGLAVLTKNNIWSEALTAAYQRAKELSQ